MSQLTICSFTDILSLFPTEKGERKRPIYDNYRPSFSFNSINHFSGEISFPGLDELKPGETATAKVKLLPSKHVSHHLKVGDSFSLLEGRKVVGTGVIQEIEKI